MKNYLIIGLTGQSGAGKTTVSKHFAEKGFALINCDTISRNVTRKGSECCKALQKYFPGCFDCELELDRQALAKIVFSSKDKLELLNNTIFPFIIRDINAEIERLADSGEKYIMLDAPTLFESGLNRLCDCIVSCVADKQTRIKRIAKRDNIPDELIEKRFDSQLSEEFFRTHSDYTIENNKDESFAQKQCEEISKEIKRKLNGTDKS
ncbi:MAG: dephospho-CoA kinase [Oscillospiraceae bacterium]